MTLLEKYLPINLSHTRDEKSSCKWTFDFDILFFLEIVQVKKYGITASGLGKKIGRGHQEPIGKRPSPL